MLRSNILKFLPLVLLIQLMGLYVFSPSVQAGAVAHWVENLWSGEALPFSAPPGFDL